MSGSLATLVAAGCNWCIASWRIVGSGTLEEHAESIFLAPSFVGVLCLFSFHWLGKLGLVEFILFWFQKIRLCWLLNRHWSSLISIFFPKPDPKVTSKKQDKNNLHILICIHFKDLRLHLGYITKSFDSAVSVPRSSSVLVSPPFGPSSGSRRGSAKAMGQKKICSACSDMIDRVW